MLPRLLLRSSPLALLLALLFAPFARPQSASRITTPIQNASRITIPRTHLSLLSRARDLGPLVQDQALDQMILVLKMAPEQQQALTALLDNQQTKGSPSYHGWLTPIEFGRRFGPAPDDVAQVVGWLQQQGFRIDSTAKSGIWIEFSGNVGLVNAAFHTQMHRYQIGGENHIANATDISVPTAIAPLVAGVPLHNFFSKPMIVPRRVRVGRELPGAASRSAAPEITAPWNGAHAIVPADFATIYDLNPLYRAGLNGAGQTIAIVGESDINPSDIAAFQTIFGVPSNLPNVIDVGADPGVDTTQGYGDEATIDTEWASAVAQGAKIDLVVSSPTSTTDGAALSALYIVDQNLAQIVSVSYGNCEQNLGTAGNALWNSLWEQAAAQGISGFVASGDSGSVACDEANVDVVGQFFGPMAVNGLASTPFNTAVGGTEFNEGANNGNASTFWNAANGTFLGSATGYIPEMVWNDSCDDSNAPYVDEICATNLPDVNATGGGVSTIYATPSWQTLHVTGLPTLSSYTLPNEPGVNPRGVPDISLAASAAHDGYLYCFTTNSATPDCQLDNGALAQTTFQNEAGGTSFSAPEFAGIMAIVNQRTKAVGPSPSPSPIADGRQGLANYTLYALAASETFSGCNASNRTNPAHPATAGCTFNDITFGSNAPPAEWSAPGVAGYGAAAGYDLVSGLGSVDASNLVTNWTSAAASFHGSQTLLTTGVGSGGISAQHGQPVVFDATVQKLSGDPTTQDPSGQVALIAQGGTLSGSFGAGAAALTGASAGSATTGNVTVGDLPGGKYDVTAKYPGDGAFAGSVSTSIPVTVTAESSIANLNVYQYSAGYGTPVQFVVQVAGASGQGYPSGTIALTDGAKMFATIPLSANATALLNTCGGTGYFPADSTLPCFLPGSHRFFASYSGDVSFSRSPTPPAPSQVANLTIPKGSVVYFEGATPTYTSQSTSGAINVPVTVSATLPVPSPQAARATGTVQFFLNSVSLGPPVPVEGNPAQASLPNATLPQGYFVLTANYSGDSNYVPLSMANPLTLGVPLGWIAKTTATTINPGQTATYNLTLSNSSYIGQVPITCVAGTDPGQPATPPAGVQCTLSVSSANLTTISQKVSVVATITTSEQSRLRSAPFGALPFSLPPVLAFMLWGFRRRRWHSLIVCALAAVAISSITACGSGNTTTPPTQPAATSAVFTVFAETSTTNSGVTNSLDTGVTLTTNINQ
jgi:large repetitive protein